MSPLNPSIVGAISGAITVAALFLIARRKNLRIGEGSQIGYNLQQGQKCPSCGTSLPAARTPKNFRQLLWGGWTCEGCGKEYDKWLSPVQAKEPKG